MGLWIPSRLDDRDRVELLRRVQCAIAAIFWGPAVRHASDCEARVLPMVCCIRSRMQRWRHAPVARWSLKGHLWMRHGKAETYWQFLGGIPQVIFRAMNIWVKKVPRLMWIPAIT